MDSTVSDVEELLENKYVNLSAAVLLLWDTIIIFHKDIFLLRRDGWTKTQIAYLFNRFMSCVALFYLLSTLFSSRSKTLTEVICYKTSIVVVTILHLFSFAISDALLAHRCYIFWNRQIYISRILILSYFICYSSIIITGTIYSKELFDSSVLLEFQDPFGNRFEACSVKTSPPFGKGLWLTNTILDICLITLMIINAFDRPRYFRDKVTKSLLTDGIITLSIILSMRILNLALSFTESPSLALISIPVVWSIITILVSRLTLNLLLVEGEKRMAPKGQALIELEVHYDRDPSVPDTEENAHVVNTVIEREIIAMTPLSNKFEK